MSYNIFAILNHLYTDTTIKWISEVEDNEIQPYLLQRWLCMNDAIKNEVKWLDKYVFHLPPKMYLSLAWSIIPKNSKLPFIKYIKKEEEEEEFDFILEKVRKQYQLSDNDYRAVKARLVKQIREHPVGWFKFYGIDRPKWKQYSIDYNILKI